MIIVSIEIVLISNRIQMLQNRQSSFVKADGFQFSLSCQLEQLTMNDFIWFWKRVVVRPGVLIDQVIEVPFTSKQSPGIEGNSPTTERIVSSLLTWLRGVILNISPPVRIAPFDRINSSLRSNQTGEISKKPLRRKGNSQREVVRFGHAEQSQGRECF